MNDEIVNRDPPLVLSADEHAIVLFLRTLSIDRAEALVRLATPVPSPVLPGGQELHANSGAVAPESLEPEPPAGARS